VKQVFYFSLFFLCGILLHAQPSSVDAGPYQKVCPGISANLGGSPTATGGVPTYTYNWQPAGLLNNSTIANPIAYPSVTTTFTVAVTDSDGKTASDTVTILVYNDLVDAGAGQTINAGQTITLHGSTNGANSVNWSSQSPNIYHANTLTPDVFPPVTTVYLLTGIFADGCTVYDNLTITVIPSDKLVFFNTFTPNGDGANDFWVIGNIEKYPDNVLEIYNRYGQKVFNKTGYQNDWDGKYLNEELPAGTYFYVMDTKSPAGGKYKGSITIVR
jgi:gliding motility-associated-like protein